ETVKKPKQTDIGESLAGTISVNSIPDKDDSGSSDDEDTAPLSGWQLAHVCQRWRYLIFASASRFDLELVCSPGIPVGNTLGSLPAIPIVIKYHSEVSSKDTDNAIAALKYPDRVRRITLSGVTRALWEKLDAAMQELFPALTHLSLTGPRDQDERVPVLPLKLLGGGTLSLRELYLQGISYPALPQFLLSVRDLVKLNFIQIPPSCYISPEKMLTGLAGLTRLESLSIAFLRPSILTNLLMDQRLTAPEAPTVHLPALDFFWFKGFCEYLEGLLAQIDAPQFLVRSEYLKSPEISTVQVRFIPWTDIWCCGSTSSKLINFTCKFNTSGMVRGVLHAVQLFQQISASLTNIANLTLVGPAPASADPPFGGSLYGGSRFAGSLFGETLFGRPLLELPGVQDSIDHIDWIGLFRPFTGVNKLCLRGELSENVIHALELVRGDMTAKLLPALRALKFIREQPTVSVDQFVSTRQKAGRPVSVSYPDGDDDEGGDDDEDDEGEDGDNAEIEEDDDE
ncbi:hypothetical protein V8E53_007505, partial [Lactarius tabidus]